VAKKKTYVCWFETLGADDVARVGGKNASLGEMIRALTDEGIRVPDGFATTAEAYRAFLEANDLLPQIRTRLKDWQDGRTSLPQLGKALRRLFQQAEFPEDIATAICQAYRELSQRYRTEQCHGGGSSRGEFRWPARDLSEYHRRGCAPGGVPSLLCLAVHRSRHQLPTGEAF
jgi:phosphoenolpyruvate synthase/pyruvate phosphate dikinase